MGYGPAIALVSRRHCDPGFCFPSTVRGWRLDVWVGTKIRGGGQGGRGAGDCWRNLVRPCDPA